MFQAGSILAIAVASGIWLDVPFVQQEKNGCGAACISMVARYWGGREVPASARPLSPAQMENAFRERGFRTFVFRAGWDDLNEHLAKGRPLIVCLEKHYVVVAGLDREQQLALINDPAQRKLLKVDRYSFEKAWSRAGNWTLLAVPQSPM
jgi:ABC-type bacteriocin/lantibiotic exporter with double-glycine peptidase domain